MMGLMNYINLWEQRRVKLKNNDLEGRVGFKVAKELGDQGLNVKLVESDKLKQKVLLIYFKRSCT